MSRSLPGRSQQLTGETRDVSDGGQVYNLEGNCLKLVDLFYKLKSEMDTTLRTRKTQ